MLSRPAPSPRIQKTPSFAWTTRRTAAQCAFFGVKNVGRRVACAVRAAADRSYRRCSDAQDRADSGVWPCSGAFDEQHLLTVVGLFHFHFDGLVLFDLLAAADICCLDGKFAMSTVDQHGKLHPSWTPMVE